MGVKRQLGGSCCIPKCKTNCPNCPIHEHCVEGCKPRAQSCAKDDKGFFAELRYLQLHDIDVPDRVMERRLLGLVRELEKEREEYLNQEALVKKQTDILVNQFRNNATKSIAYSEASAQLLREKTKTEAVQRVETARADAMSSMCTKLAITQPKHILTLQYLLTLKDSTNLGNVSGQRADQIACIDNLILTQNKINIYLDAYPYWQTIGTLNELENDYYELLLGPIEKQPKIEELFQLRHI
ncbi:unnamed protein product [Rotaria sp. Silwood1]|nr:unnamed protein product [Rotaria sp. Silwood1]